jgi:hypothetical protein
MEHYYKTFIATLLLCLCIAAFKTNADDSLIYKYPDISNKNIGMQPIIEEEDINPKGRRKPKQEFAVKQVPNTSVETKKISASKALPQKAEKAEPSLSIPIDHELRDISLRENQTLNAFIKNHSSQKNKDIKIHAFGLIGKDNSISAAKRRALSNALIVRQYLLDNYIPSKHINMKIDTFSVSKSNTDLIDIY